MTMNYYFTQGAIIAVIVNVLLFAAWRFARTAEHRILNNARYQAEEQVRLSSLMRDLENKRSRRHTKATDRDDAENSPVPQETTEATDRDEQVIEQVRLSSLLRDLELQYDKGKIRASFFGSNYCDFGAMFFSAILLEAGLILVFYTGGLYYYLGILLIFSAASSGVWIFAGIASSPGGRNDMLNRITAVAVASPLAEKALDTAREALALSNEARKDTAVGEGAPPEVIPIVRPPARLVLD